MKVLICYPHVSPHQVPALLRAAQTLREAGAELLVAEQAGSSLLHGWTLADAPRPSDWICLCPTEERPSRVTTVRKLAAIVRDRRVDVVVVNGWADPASWAVALMRRILRVRVIVVSDSTALDRERRPGKEAAKRCFLRLVDGVFTAGSRQVQYLARLGVPQWKFSTGCDVVNNADFAAVQGRSTGPDSEQIVIGTVARLVPEKNLAHAMDALGRFVRARDLPPIIWRIAGRGPLEGELKTRAASLGLTVEFIGFQPYDRMPAFYAGIDLYWQPSRSEPWGLAINEAMASGLPVLASSRCGSVDDLVHPDNGWIHGLMPAEIEAGLARAIVDRPRWPAMGHRSRARIADWDLARFAEGLRRAVEIAVGRSLPSAASELRRPEPAPISR